MIFFGLRQAVEDCPPILRVLDAKKQMPKMAVSWSKNKYFGLRQAVAEPAPPILRVLDAKKHAVWTHRLPKHNLQHSYAPKSAIFQQNRRKIAIFLSNFFF